MEAEEGRFLGNSGQLRARLSTTWPEAADPGERVLYCPWLDGPDHATQLWLAVLGWHDVNGRLLAALKQLPDGVAAHPQIFAGMFCADPFCDMRTLFAALLRAGVSGIVNLPSVTFLDGEVAETLESLNLGAERELACLRQARDACLRIVGCAADSVGAIALSELGAEFLVVHGGAPAPGSQKRETALRRAAANRTRLVAIGLGDLLRFGTCDGRPSSALLHTAGHTPATST